MAKVRIGHSSGKAYRDLHVLIGGKILAMEDLELNRPDLTLQQRDAIERIGGGNFSIYVEDDGTLSFVLNGQ